MSHDVEGKASGCASRPPERIGPRCDACPSPARRAFLLESAILGAAAFGATILPRDLSAQEPGEQRPAPGDRLVLADGPADRAPLKLGDVPVDAGKPVFAFPYDAATKTVRDGSKLNRLLLIRMADEAAPAKGVLAFSAICTHEGCTVSEWLAAERHLLCPCHFSKFDVRDGGAAVEGPAPRGLPRLPLRIDESTGDLIVAGVFSAQPGVRRTT